MPRPNKLLKPRQELTHDLLTQILNYDQQTGVFTWKLAHQGYQQGRPVGSVSKYGRRFYIGQHLVYNAELAWFYMTGSYPPNKIRHKNGDIFDDRFENLELCDYDRSKIKPSEIDRDCPSSLHKMLRRVNRPLITQDFVNSEFEYNPELGTIIGKSTAFSRRMYLGKSVVRNTVKGAVVHVNGLTVAAGALAVLMMTGIRPKGRSRVRYKDGNPSNIKWSNIEFTLHAHRFGRALKKSYSKTITGVTFSKANGLFKAYININRKKRHLGYFDKFVDAVRARAAAEENYTPDLIGKTEASDFLEKVSNGEIPDDYNPYFGE